MKLHPYQERALRMFRERQINHAVPVASPSVAHIPREVAAGPPTAALVVIPHGKVQSRREAGTDGETEGKPS